jgi:ferritin-like metal-binding protein YciE
MVESRSAFSLVLARLRSFSFVTHVRIAHYFGFERKIGRGRVILAIRLVSDVRISNTMQLETLQDLYVHELKDLYSAEKQLIKALPKMVKAAKNGKLAAGFEEHLEQTREHAARLERILSNHKKSTRGARCRGMEGIIAEGSEMVEEEADPEVKDAGLISAAQRVEHYEIAGYGTARTYAEMLGDKEGAKLLQTTLGEEEETDQKLTKLAKSSINVAAIR